MTHGATRNVLVVLAHQDDEIALAATLLREVRAGAVVHCVFLTDGSGQGSPADRDEESRAVLTRLGLQEPNLHFLGSTHGVRDGQLMKHLDDALAALDTAVGGIAFDAIYALAWEGGHHDHDASHLACLAFAHQRGLVDTMWCAPLYNGFRRPGVLFRVMSPLRGGEWRREIITRTDARFILGLTSVYATQKRTWRALMAGTAIQLLLFGRQLMQRADVGRVRTRPHHGRLYYEKRFGVPYPDFEASVRSFVERRLS